MGESITYSSGDVGSIEATIDGVITVEDGGGSLTVDGPVTDAQLRATAVPVGDGGGSLTVDGPLTDTQLRAAVVPVGDGGGSLTVDGPLTDTQLRAAVIPISGTVTAVDGGGVLSVDDNAGSLTVDTPQLPAAFGTGGGVKIDGSGTALPVSGPLTDTQLRATPLSVLVSDGAGPLTVDGTVAVTDGGGSLTIDDGAGSITIDSTQLPVALAAGGGFKVEGVAGGVAQPVSGTVSVTGVATEATLDARTGALTETAPASDTASSGINGRLQRIAQRLTSIITLFAGGLPAALAAGGGLKVEGVASGVPQPVTFPTYTAPVCGEIAGSATAAVLPTITCKMVMFTAEASNAGKVYLGITGVTKPDGATDTTTGIELAAGVSTPWIPVDNLNRLYRICDNAGDDLTYLVMN